MRIFKPEVKQNIVFLYSINPGETFRLYDDEKGDIYMVIDGIVKDTPFDNGNGFSIKVPGCVNVVNLVNGNLTTLKRGDGVIRVDGYFHIVDDGSDVAHTIDRRRK